jgi:DNA repair protein RadA/Sms
MSDILEAVDEMEPDILIADSIQTLYQEENDSSPGSVSQVKDCTLTLMQLSKSRGITVFVVGHINKDGNIAGPKVLEHIVDCVLQFEGDRNYGYRILRSIKNRFGSTAELGIFEMQGNGLREVANPSEILLSHRDENLSGTAISATLEGMRPMLIEIQALVSSAVYGTPQRSATGFDLRRMSMLLAVLEKRCGFKLGAKDVFLNIAGGIRVDDPALDLAVVVAILSSNVDIPINSNDCFAAEIGLSGEIRPINRVEQRIAEADKLGFERIFISKYNAKSLDKSKYNIEIVELGIIEEAFRKLFA